jgi:transcriptional regulator with XRE-family HTH domain
MYLGDQVKKLRKEHSLTQIEFSEKLCLSQSYISKIENGIDKPSKTALKLMRIVFNLNADWPNQVNPKAGS